MRLLQITLLLLTTALHTIAQDFTDFNIINYTHREVIYGANFDKLDSNSIMWVKNCSMDEFINKTINNGVYTFTTSFSSDSVQDMELPISVDYKRNFEIEFKAQLRNNAKSIRYCALFWSNDTSADSYIGQGIIIFPSGNYKMVYETGLDNKSPDVEATSRKGVYFNSVNTYTIRKIRNEYYVFVNKKFTRSYTYTPISGQNMLLSITGKTILEMDYFIVSYLNIQ